MSALIEPFGRTLSGEEVSRVTIADGLRVSILTYGGIVERLEAPGRNGVPANVVLGLSTLRDYEERSPSFGATLGRYAGRIGGARFTLDGRTFTLPMTEGQTTLHGGVAGFGKRMWSVARASRSAVILERVSPAGEEGFPGTLRTEVEFAVEGLALVLRYRAETDAPTVLNLSNHSYFNLGGEGSGDVWDHELELAADRIVEVGANSLPTGALLDVAGTPFDFRAPRRVGERVREAHPQIVAGLGYDACFVLHPKSERGPGLRFAARLREPNSGRAMEVRTDQPGLQLYSANKLTGALVGPSGQAYRSGDGLCFETQHFPDSPNQPGFPSTVLRPGVPFTSETQYVFSVL